MVTPLSCYTSPIICPRYNQTNQFQRNKSLEVHMECIRDKQFHHIFVCEFSSTFLVFSSCWPFKLNLVLAVSKIQSLILLPSNRVKRPLGSALLSQISHLFFLGFTQFWSHLVLTQFWCNFASQKPIFKFASLWCAVQSLSWNIGRKSIFQYFLLMRTFTFLRWTILSKSKFQAKLSRSWQTD